MTGMNQNDLWPNFLIIGAGKSGTTSLYHYLKSHPEVFMPDVKEPRFFCDSAQNRLTESEYKAIFKGKGEAKVWGESSVSYLYTPAACKKIFEKIGDNVKLICVLRNPVKAVYSWWGQLSKMHLEEKPARVALLSSFSLQSKEPNMGNYAWVVNYIEHIKRYRETFRDDQLKFYFYEEFFQQDLPLYTDLCGFLTIDDRHSPQNAIHNQGYIWRRTLFDTRPWQVVKPWVAPAVRAIFSLSTRENVYTMIEKWKKKPLPRLDKKLEAELQAKLYTSVRKLEKYMNKDLSKIWF